MECFVANPAYCMQFLHASAMLAVVAERVCINVCSIHLPLQYVRLVYACMCVQALKIINRAKLIFKIHHFYRSNTYSAYPHTDPYTHCSGRSDSNDCCRAKHHQPLRFKHD